MDLLELIMNVKDAEGNALSTSDLIDEAKTYDENNSVTLVSKNQLILIF